MLFNSYAFLLAFLPITLTGFFLLGRPHRLFQGRSFLGRAWGGKTWGGKTWGGKTWGAAWLVLASLVFYAYWNPRYLVLLLGSIGFNFVAGRLLARAYANDSGGPGGRALLAGAIAANLALLGYYKYAGFFVANLDAAIGLDWTVGKIILPLGISFFTFTQIAYLVDAHRGTAREAKLLHYALFVTYFPHLIAGPILHHAEMMPQFARDDVYRWRSDRFVAGMVVFAFGLVKKVVLADGIAAFVGPAFAAAEAGHHPVLVQAWGTALAYTFQLYFDFSGYCDMAIGLSWLFGIGLPLNFNSPYKARSIVDFWRRWHMTLSRFLRDYLYIPLGGNRHGPARRYANLLATMVIGGLWHGAGWTFIVWGALHGIYLVINHAWTSVRARLGDPAVGAMEALSGQALTFIAVVVGWVFFRAASLHGAWSILQGMAGMNGFAGASVSGDLVQTWMWCVGLGVIAFTLPNTEEVMAPYLPEIARPVRAHAPAALTFVPSVRWAVAVAALLAAGLISLPQPTSFLYFNF